MFCGSQLPSLTERLWGSLESGSDPTDVTDGVKHSFSEKTVTKAAFLCGG